MITVVIDTNVFLSALLFGGTPGKLISLWKSGKIQPQLNKTTVAELLRVLAYPKFELTENEIQYLLYVEILPFCNVVSTKSMTREGLEAQAVQHRMTAEIGKRNPLEADVTTHRGKRNGAWRVLHL